MSGKDSHSDVITLLQEIAERSRRHAFGLPQQQGARNLWHGIAFSLGGAQLIMPLDQVKEILKYPQLSTVPGAKPWVKGIANVRGTLLPVMDLNGFLTGERTRPQRRSRVLVVESAGVTSGLLVDEVTGMKHFPADTHSANLPTVHEAIAGFLSGSYGQDGSQWGVFAPEQLMENPDFIQVAA